MPTRYLKPGICDSATLDKCSPLAETLFYRLLVNVDDFGRLDARPAVVRAKCWPLKDSITNADTEKLLNELNSARLITLYENNNSRFLQFNKWDNVPRSQTSKFPAPPSGSHPNELVEIISENDLEDAICSYIDKSHEFAGLQVHSWARQVRHGESYFDMVLETEIGQVGVELKRTRLSSKAVEQAIKYSSISNIPFLLIGAGLGVGIDITDCKNKNVCVITYNQDFIANVVGGKQIVTKRDFTLKQVSALTVTVTVTGTDKPKPEHKPKTETKDMSALSAQTAKKGTRLADDWVLPKAWGDWALTEKPNWTADDVRRVAADFKDHWLAKAGKDAVKMDWLATWRKWVRSPLNEIKSNGSPKINKPWYITATGTEAEAVKRGILKAADEPPFLFYARVLKEAGISDEMRDAAKKDFGL